MAPAFQSAFGFVAILAPTSGQLAPAQQASSSMDAITRGALDGLALLLNIVALLIVLVALVTLANLMLEALPAIGGKPITLQRMLGGLATMAPERRDEVVALGFKSIVAGTFATCMTGAIVGMFWTG